MPYFAHITSGYVDRVERISKDVMLNDKGEEVEELGQQYLGQLYGVDPLEFVQCWYPVDQPDPYPRGRFPGIGDIWDGDNFISTLVP